MLDEPLKFITDLKPLRVMERQTAVFELRLSKKTDSPLIWKFKDKLKRDEKFDVCVPDGGLTYTIKIKDVCTSDTGDYTISIGNLTTRASLFIEHKRLIVTTRISFYSCAIHCHVYYIKTYKMHTGK